jgi:hypothetical protein
MASTLKKLQKTCARLSVDDQATVLAFAEFLQARSGDKAAAEIQQPLDIKPRENESVVAAIKRLAATYPMLDKAKMLGHTSELMTQHVIQGRDKKEVITELESVFRSQYELHIKDENQS